MKSVNEKLSNFNRNGKEHRPGRLVDLEILAEFKSVVDRVLNRNRNPIKSLWRVI